MAGITQLGKGMMTLGSLLFIGLMSLWFGDLEKDRAHPNRSPRSLIENGVIAVTLKQDRQGHYTVRGLINNSPIDFLVDTGATEVVIPAGLAERLNLERGRAKRASTANGPVTVYQTNLTRLSIADLHFDNVSGVINPGMNGTAALLGMSVLKHLELTQTGNTLVLKRQQ
jgi:aspartyl protease family protein